MVQIKLWEIDKDNVNKINKQRLDYENRLEKWLIEDISILSRDLAVIGSQIITEHGGHIDILAINSAGELIIIELKRDKTYREVISQALDYATWVKELDYDDLNTILNKYGKSNDKDISDFFYNAFSKDPEEIEFNSDHKMLIVGSEIDDSTVRIINYLSSEPYSVNINAVNFNYFKDTNSKEFLAQSFVLPEENITEESKSKKRKRQKSIISKLFDLEKLQIGQTLTYQPAREKVVGEENLKRIRGKIVNKGMNCLQRENETTLYSFSKLRSQIVDEFKIEGIQKNWGYGLRYEWVTEDNKRLIDLLKD